MFVCLSVCIDFASLIKQKERFNKNIMSKCNIDNEAIGLYQSEYEHDACGVGMIVNIH